jgi:hypothetical protein
MKFIKEHGPLVVTSVMVVSYTEKYESVNME